MVSTYGEEGGTKRKHSEQQVHIKHPVNNSSLQRMASTYGEEGGTKRKHSEQQVHIKHPVNNSSLQTNTKGCHTDKTEEEEDTKFAHSHSKNNIVDYDAMKENKNAESNRIPNKQQKMNDKAQNNQRKSNDNCKRINSTIDNQIGRNADDKDLSLNNTTTASSEKIYKSVCVDKKVKSNHLKRKESPTDLAYPRNHKQQILQSQEDEKERSIRFAKLFCSRSIKSSSRVKHIKKIENAIKNNMHSVLPLLKDNQGLKHNTERKRKRSIDNDSQIPSTLNSAAIGSNRKRLKYDVRNRHLDQE